MPQTWLISSEAYELFLEEHSQLERIDFYPACLAFLKKHFDAFVLGLNIPIYAVRSSIVYEEEEDINYSGVFETFLSVKKTELILYIAKVWASLFSKKKEKRKIGVILQPMLFEKIAGVVFSKHPSPSSSIEEEFMMIEYAKTGEIGDTTKRFDIVMRPEKIQETAKEKWIEEVATQALHLSKHLSHPIYAEFILDEEEVIWLILQGPFLAKTRVLDLKLYDREQKGEMSILSVEMQLDGVCKFLPAYLEFYFKLDPWIVMTTDEEGQREIWVERRYQEAVLEEIEWKIQTDPAYLNRILARYENYQKLPASLQKYLSGPLSLLERFRAWYDLMLLIVTHCKVPFLMLDALRRILILEMEKIDSVNASSDLNFIGSYDIKEKGRDIFDKLVIKYCIFSHAKEYFKAFREMNKILKEKNKANEKAIEASKPLLEEMGKKLGISPRAIWEMGFEEIMICFRAKSAALTQKIEFSHQTMLRTQKKMILSSQIKVINRH